MIVFLSTGRCGTQWLADCLARAYAGRLVARHEPLGPHYAPRLYFRRYDELEAMARRPPIAAHLAELESRGHPYVETGWPVYAALPSMAQRFPERLRIVHLTRHLVPTALSHMAHQTYSGSPRQDGYTLLATLDPWSGNVLQADHAGFWDELTPYERCLFWCTEVHAYAPELRARLEGIPWLTLRYEDVFAGDAGALRELVAFIGVPFSHELVPATSRPVDRWHHHSPIAFDWRRIERHPLSMRVLADLGYGLDEIDEDALRRRYAGEPAPGPAFG